MRWNSFFVGDLRPVGFGSGLLGGVANLASLDAFLGLVGGGELGRSQHVIYFQVFKDLLFQCEGILDV